MTRLTYNLTARITAIFLFVITVLAFISGIAGIYFMVEYNFYTAPAEEVKREIFDNITRLYANQVFYSYFPAFEENTYELDILENTFSNENTNFLFVLKDADDKTILTNYSNQEYQYSYSYRYEKNVYSSQYGTLESKSLYTIYCYVNKNLNATDKYSIADYWINFAYPKRYSLIVITIVSLIASAILLVFLMCSAGRRKGEDKVIINGVDKIPYDVLLGIILAIVGFELSLSDNIDTSVGMIIFSVFTVIFVTLLGLLAVMSFASRYKAGILWKNTILYRITKFFLGMIRWTYRGIKYLLQHLPLLWKVILILSALTFFELIVMAIGYDNSSILVLLWIPVRLLLIFVILLTAINLNKLKIGGQRIAGGDINYKIDTRHMFWDFKYHAENLNRIGNGMSKAVDERMKSERFKTELITNVSHDIKTPLTSIINYVDLIKKEVTEDGTVKDYVNVLDRQSARLKKLVDDLVEASKASTGNMPVNMSRTEVGVLLTQTVGEYEEKIKDSGLELILKKPESDIFIMADGRLIWRVFDNLMGNICKYAQPGTRAYLDLGTINGQVVIIFRNISKYALNITSEELFERFVRGDSSRNTDGSGLGLSIAKSLVELQKGKMELYIDGDLFKVILKFDIIS